MLQNSFQEQLEDCPVIAAARDMKGLARCCQSESGIVFILFGDVCTISEIVDHVKSAGKLAFVHMDLVNGLSSREISVDYSKRNKCGWNHFHKTATDPPWKRTWAIHRAPFFYY